MPGNAAAAAAARRLLAETLCSRCRHRCSTVARAKAYNRLQLLIVLNLSNLSATLALACQVTPTKLRLRKRTLESGMRRQQKRKEDAMAATA